MSFRKDAGRKPGSVAQDPLPGSAVRHTAFASATSLVTVNNGPVPHNRGGCIAGPPWRSVGIRGRPIEGFLVEYAAAGRLHRLGRQARITANGATSRSLRRGRGSRGCQCEHGSGQRHCDSHVDHSLMTHRLAPMPAERQTCRFAVNSTKRRRTLPRIDGADPVLAYHRRRDCPAMQQMYLLDLGAVSIFQRSVVTSALPARFAILRSQPRLLADVNGRTTIAMRRDQDVP